ncbi:ANTAR domain-containing protein [Psychromonas sp. SP041]|uniref:ANTAR domain-containing response regulator n=1 Tax=Psychromonas sp. SP041 TaxID=1365007 RepID=UPI00041D2FA9|nr:ANTAR domain-containing protein [Psychromonas sp. SP041]
MSSSPAKDYQLIRRLRQMRVLVIHPDDSDRKILIDHIKRIGCNIDYVWPAPKVLEQDIDVVIFLIDNKNNKNSISWMANDESVARIGVIAYETPEILVELDYFHVHGVISKPIRIFGLLAVLTTAISFSKHEKRLKKRINSLDETLKGRRKVEQAVAILSELKNITEQESYKFLREQSMIKKCSIADIADSIIDDHSMLNL